MITTGPTIGRFIHPFYQTWPVLSCPLQGVLATQPGCPRHGFIGFLPPLPTHKRVASLPDSAFVSSVPTLLLSVRLPVLPLTISASPAASPSLCLRRYVSAAPVPPSPSIPLLPSLRGPIWPVIDAASRQFVALSQAAAVAACGGFIKTVSTRLHVD